MSAYPMGPGDRDEEELRRSENEGFGQKSPGSEPYPEDEAYPAAKQPEDETFTADKTPGDEGFASDRDDTFTADRDETLTADRDEPFAADKDEAFTAEKTPEDEPYTVDKTPEDHAFPAGKTPEDEPFPETAEAEVLSPAAETTDDDLVVAGDRSDVEDTPIDDKPRPTDADRSLFDDGFADEFLSRWHEVQAGFVDDPYETVRQAEQLAGEAVGKLTSAITERKSELDDRWHNEKDNTEELRQALKGYRVLMDRLLAL